MASPGESAPPGTTQPAERIPALQRAYDNPFLLLFLGVTVPAVFYLMWGLIELTQIPIAK